MKSQVKSGNTVVSTFESTLRIIATIPNCRRRDISSDEILVEIVGDMLTTAKQRITGDFEALIK
jgi:hypothetical protein